MSVRAIPRQVSELLGLEHTGADVYPLLDWPLAVRAGGALWLIGAAGAVALFPFTAPTHVVGQVGWYLAGAEVALAVAAGSYLLARAGAVSVLTVLVAGYAGAVALALAQVLVGPQATLTMTFLLLAAYQAAVHPARRFLPLLATIAALLAASSVVAHPTMLAGAQTLVAVLMMTLLSLLSLVNATHARSLSKELQLAQARSERLALTDPLTGLSNRRAFDRVLAQRVAASRRYEVPLSLVMLDLDGFKAVNDRLGHEAGDAALVAAARAIAGAIRAPDDCFRWAGDEFALVLPETRATEAAAVAGRVRAAVHREARTAEGRPLSITWGAAMLEAGDDGHVLVDRADAALFRAKRECAPGAAAPVAHA